jgi:hypothetical protein
MVMETGPTVSGVDSGMFFNHVHGVEVFFCRRGLHLSQPWGLAPPNANYFYSFRAADDCIIGVDLEAGSANVFFALAMEGVVFTPAGSILSGVVAAATALKVGRGGDSTGSAALFGNMIFGFRTEACNRETDCNNGTLQIDGGQLQDSLCFGTHPKGGRYFTTSNHWGGALARSLLSVGPLDIVGGGLIPDGKAFPTKRHVATGITHTSSFSVTGVPTGYGRSYLVIVQADVLPYGHSLGIWASDGATGAYAAIVPWAAVGVTGLATGVQVTNSIGITSGFTVSFMPLA